MAVAFVSASASQQGKNSDTHTHPGITPTVGNNLVVLAHCWDNSAPTGTNFTVTDDEGNTWEYDVRAADVEADQHIVVAHLNDVPSYTTDIVITVANTTDLGNAWWGVTVMEFSGGDFTLNTSGTTTATAETTHNSSSVTNGDIAVASFSHDASTTAITPNAGTGTWTQRSETESGAQGQPFNTLTSPTSGTVQASWATPGSVVSSAMAIVTYDEGSGAVNAAPELTSIAATTTMTAAAPNASSSRTLTSIAAPATLPDATATGSVAPTATAIQTPVTIPTAVLNASSSRTTTTIQTPLTMPAAVAQTEVASDTLLPFFAQIVGGL